MAEGTERKMTASSLGRCRRGYGSPDERALLQNNRSGANLGGGVDFGLGKVDGELERDHLLVGVDWEGGDVGFGEGVLELLEERDEGDGPAGTLIARCASASLGYLKHTPLAPPAAPAPPPP